MIARQVFVVTSGSNRMAWQTSWMIVPLLIAAFLLLVLGLSMLLLVTRERMTPTIGALLVFCLAGATWAIAEAYQVANTGASKRIWFAIGSGSFVVVVFAWLVFALAASERERWLSLPRIAPVLAGGGVLAGLFFTNPVHGALWESTIVSRAGLFVLDVQFTAIYGGAMLGLLTVTGLGIAVLWVYGTQRDGVSLRAIGWMVAGISFPVGTGLLYHVGLGPGVNLTPIALGGTASTLTYLVFTRELIGRVPLPRSAVLNRMDEGLVVVGADGHVSDLNPAAKSLLDLEETALGRTVTDVIPEWPDGVDDDRTTVDLTVEDGDRRHLRIRVSPLSDSHHSQIGLISDRTEQEALQQRYRAIIEESAEANVLLDENGTIIYASPSVERIFGWTSTEMEGETAFEFVAETDRERIRAEFERVLANPGYEPRLEYRVVDREGHECVFESLVRNLLDHPHVEAIAVTSRDVTERREREQELERMNERLEEFASILSHDLRNPLEVAEIHTTLAQRGDEDALETVQQAHDRIDAMIDDILTYVREDDTVDPDEIAFEPVVQSAWETVHTRGATLSFDMPAETVIEADRRRLQRALENLFRNSIEHGGEAVTVRIGRADAGFFVADDGPGIPPEDRASVFDNGFTTAEEGTGLGLAIVRRTAQAHGWTVTATESESGGARFEFGNVSFPSED